MERAKNAGDSLSRLGKLDSLAILQQIKEAGGQVEYNELKKAGEYSELHLSHRLRELQIYGLITKDIMTGKGIFYILNQKGVLVLEEALELHDIFSKPQEKTSTPNPT